MIRILIVDDELIVRIGIRSMIDWGQNGFEIVGEAADGIEALELIKKLSPNIVLTDIKMQNMDGIELLKKIREEELPVKVVVLSCYNEFEYVKKALKLGASDYVLKLSMQPQDLLNVMNTTKAEFLKLPPAKTQQLASPPVQNVWTKNIRKYLLQQNEPVAGPLDGLEDPSVRFLVFSSKICRKQVSYSETNDYPKLQNAAQNFITDIISEKFECSCFLYETGMFVTVIKLEQTFDGSVLESVTGLIERFQTLIETHLNCNTTVGLEPSCISLNQLHDCFFKTQLAVTYGFYFERNQIFTAAQVHYDEEITHIFDFAKIRHYFDELGMNHIDSVKQDLQTTLEGLKAKRNVHPKYVRKACKSVLNVLHMSLLSQVYEESTYNSSNLFDVNILEQVDTLEQIKSVLFSCLDTFISIQQTSCTGTYHQKMQELQEYLKSHVADKVTLEDAAEFVNLSKTYFCLVFKLEFGKTFNDYLTDIKISAAKKLLKTTPFSIDKIAEKTGYSNPNYFYTIFRKATGMSPNQFRNS